MRRHLLLALLMFLLGVWLTGCATLPVVGQVDSRVEQALKEIPRRGAWERSQCWSGMRVVMNSSIPTAAIGVCVIHLNPRVLSWPYDELRAALAHELGHMRNNDASVLRAGVPQLKKEQQADARAVVLLARISLEACLALPRLFERLEREFGNGASNTHPSYPDRNAATVHWCKEADQAERDGKPL
jgi:hypothetical protein